MTNITTFDRRPFPLPSPNQLVHKAGPGDPADDLPPGTVVTTGFVDGEARLAPASANASFSGAALAIGICATPLIVDSPVIVQFAGILTLPEEFWEQVVTNADATLGLKRNRPYWLTTSGVGKLTDTEPGSGSIQVLGRALSSTAFAIQLAISAIS